MKLDKHLRPENAPITRENVTSSYEFDYENERGVVASTNLQGDSFGSINLADNSVTEAKIVDGAVTEDKIGDLDVTSDKIGTSAVTETKIADGAVSEDKIASLAVTSSKIGTAAVITEKLYDYAVTAIKIGTAAVTNEKINDLDFAKGTGVVNATQGTFGDGTNYSTLSNTGLLTMAGSARVYKNEWLDVGSFRVPGSNPATETEWGISSGWEFTDGAVDIVYDTIRLPQDMDRSDAPQMKIGWAAGSASGSVVWQFEYLYRTASEDTTAAAQGTIFGTTAVSGTANGLTITTLTGLDLPSASDQLMMLRIKRIGTATDDNLGDDCTLLGCGLRYTVNKLGGTA